jgi:hypothetical protein
LLDKAAQLQIFMRSAIVAVSVLVATVLEQKITGDVTRITTIGFASLSAALLFQAWLWGGSRKARNAIKGNARLDWSMTINMAVSYFLLLAAVYLPGLQTILKTQPLGLAEAVIVLAASSASWLVAMLFTRDDLILKAQRQSFFSKHLG